MASWAWTLLCIIMLLVVVDRVRLTRQVQRMRRRHEELDDEIWEVQSAIEAQRRAEAASHAKSRFLATLSHELRTPLNGIIGLANLLGGTPLDREQQSYVTAITTSGQALTTLIDEILDFSRIEAGRLELDPTRSIFVLSSRASSSCWRLGLRTRGLRSHPGWIRRSPIGCAAMWSGSDRC